MQKFNTLKSVPAYLPIVNIDTKVPINAANNAQFINLTNIQIK